MRYEVEPDGTLRIVEDDQTSPRPHRPSDQRGPRSSGSSIMTVAHHVCYALVALAVVLGLVMGLLSPIGLLGTLANGVSRGWAALTRRVFTTDILYGPRMVLQRVAGLHWEQLLLWLLGSCWSAIQSLLGLLLAGLAWVWNLLIGLLSFIF